MVIIILSNVLLFSFLKFLFSSVGGWNYNVIFCLWPYHPERTRSRLEL